MTTIARVDKPELMDTLTLPVDDMRDTLAFLGVTSKYFGGARVVLRHLEKWTQDRNALEPITVMDIGTGGAEIPIAIAAWARRTGRRVRILAVDKVTEVAQIARDNCRAFPEIEIVERDISELVEEGTKVDFVTASLFLHHIPPAQTVSILKTLDRLAVHGVIVSDLIRSIPSYCAVRLLSLLIGNYIVRHDAPLSVRRAFTPDELNAAAIEADLPYLRISPERFFRISLAGTKS